MSDIPYLVGSLIAGIVVAIGITWVSPISTVSVEKTSTITDKIDDENVQATLKKSPHLKKFFGVEATDENGNISNEKLSAELENAANDDPVFYPRMILNIIVFCFGVFAANVISKGDFGRFLVGMFPVEAEALKIKSWLESWR